MRVEHYQGELPVVRVELDPAGVWDHSKFPDDLTTLDFDAEGRLIGFELVGSHAGKLAATLVEMGLAQAREEPAVRELLEA
jgi:hypothetical protein